MTRNPAPAAAPAPPAPAADLPGLPGVRCLGGLGTGDGATTLPGRVFRGPAHALLGPGSAAALRALGVTTVIDLRGAGEGEVADLDAQARRDANAFLRLHPRPHEMALHDAALESALAGARGELLDFLRGDPQAALRAAGLTAADVAGLRARLLAA